MKRVILALLLAGCSAAPPGPTGAATNGTAALPAESAAATNGTTPGSQATGGEPTAVNGSDPAAVNGTAAATNGTARPDLPQTEAVPAVPDAGIPVYPGAKAIGGGQLKLKGKLDSFLATLDYQTPDPVGKVVSWYQKKLPKARLTRLQEPGYELVTLQDPSGQITVSRSGPQGPTLVNLVRQQQP